MKTKLYRNSWTYCAESNYPEEKNVLTPYWHHTILIPYECTFRATTKTTFRYQTFNFLKQYLHLVVQPKSTSACLAPKKYLLPVTNYTLLHDYLLKYYRWFIFSSVKLTFSKNAHNVTITWEFVREIIQLVVRIWKNEQEFLRHFIEIQNPESVVYELVRTMFTTRKCWLNQTITAT